jgi:cysteine desulfurase
MPENKPIYLDYNATTPIDPRVLEIMMPYFTEHFGNSASSQHMWGWSASRAVEKARKQVASLLSTEPAEIFFTSGATEGNNWVFQSLFHQWQESGEGGRFHILSSPVEHSSVMKTLEYLKKLGAVVEFVPVNSYGQVDASEVEKRIQPDTRLMSFIWANNEIGSLNPIQELGRIAHQHKVYLHSDATQAVGKIKVNLQESLVDFVTLSAHKIYGPKGVGALYIRSKNPRIELQPLIWGGGHEKGLRSGTVNVPGVAGLGAACEICNHEMAADSARLTGLRDQFLKQLFQEIPSVRWNGHPSQRVYTNMSLTFPNQSLEQALPVLMRLGFSTGSACHSGSMAGSYVLKAIGFSDGDMASTLRLSLGRFTTPEDLSETLILLKKAFVKDQSPATQLR